MRAMDIMSTAVISVGPDTSVQDLAALLVEHGISGVPVVDAAGKLIGIVSEGDLLRRAETGTDRRSQKRRARWFDIFGSDRNDARDYVMAHARKVQDIMTRDVITISEQTRLNEVADLLETKRIKRAPVVRDGKVVGIVSRSNLVRALSVAPILSDIDTISDDRSIRQRLLTELKGQEWVRPWATDIVVKDKIVHIWVPDDEFETTRQAFRVAAENTPGVRGVEEHLVPMPVPPLM